ncbi:MAG: archaemetzincin family Zn-dependent metalloprotease [Terriglobales bacterium]
MDRDLLEDLRARIGQVFLLTFEVVKPALAVDFAYHPERRQYHSSEILARMMPLVGPKCWRLLGVTGLDLYIPILTYVFGEAQLTGRCALVSTHRLHQEFYGLPPDRELLHQRLLKEAVHELGHTLELTHCDDYDCVMSSSHSVEWIDLKGQHLCSACHARAKTGG